MMKLCRSAAFFMTGVLVVSASVCPVLPAAASAFVIEFTDVIFNGTNVKGELFCNLVVFKIVKEQFGNLLFLGAKGLKKGSGLHHAGKQISLDVSVAAGYSINGFKKGFFRTALRNKALGTDFGIHSFFDKVTGIMT